MSILRLLLLILVLLNLLALAASAGWLGERQQRGEPERLTNQLYPERIQLRTGAESSGLDTARTPPPALPDTPDVPPVPPPASEPETPATPTPQPAAGQSPPALAPQGCMAFTRLNGEQADSVVRLFDTPNFSVRRAASETVTGWWVYIPSGGTREYADNKVRELRAIGITDFFTVLEPGPNQYAVSLGVFKTEAAANQHLEQLRGQQIRNARVGTRTATVYRVEVRGPQLQLNARRRSGSLPGTIQTADCTP